MSFSESDAFRRGQGCGCSVLISALVTAVAVWVFFLSTEGGGLAGLAFIVAFLSAILVIGLAAIVIGLPLTQILESNGWERPWSYPLAGFVFGGVIAYITAVAIDEPVNVTPESLFVLLTGALPGALCGGLWWWFERRHVHGRDPEE